MTARDRQALMRVLLNLTEDPGAVDLRKLAGRENEWRLRVGKWRAVLELDTRSGEIHVLRVLPRSRAYRD